MKRNFLLAVAFTCIIASFYFYFSYKKKLIVTVGLTTEFVHDTCSFTLLKGDILVRPNWDWLPGSYSIQNGRRYGHAALVTKGATGATINEALEKASVVEALFFDQATRKFQFKKKNQIRETNALVSFGKRFKGIRYRLRTNLTSDQVENMIQFARNQLDGGYNILSEKKYYRSVSNKTQIAKEIKNENWHCATLIWEAYYLISDTDIDSNKGIFVYPADIVASKYFDIPDGRIRF